MGSYSQGAQKAGAYPGEGRDVGYGLCVQEVSIQAGGAATLDVVGYIPDGAQLVDVLLDTITAHTSATATIAGGTAAGGTELFPATDAKAGGRVRPTFTAAQLTVMRAMAHVSGEADVPVYLRLALGTPTSVGLTKVQLVYAPKL